MLGVDTKDIRTQLPGPLNRLLLEVIAEGKVAEHLKKRVMPRRAAHVLDVVGANALLATGSPRRWPLLLPEEDRLERQHPRNGEQHRGILRNQGGAGHHFVAPLFVKAQECRPNLRTGAGGGSSGSRRTCNSHGGFRVNNRSNGHDRP